MTVSDIQNKMLSQIDNKFDKSDGGFTYDIVRAVAEVLNDQQIVANNTLDKMNVDNLKDDELERFVYQRSGVEKKYATYATERVLLTGSVGATVSIGDLVAADTIFYEIIEEGVIDTNGQLFVEVMSQEPGAVGNVPVGAINSFPQTLTGITSVTNLEAVTNGYEAESDNSLRQRYYDKLQRPGKAGNVNHYREWALEVTGVGKVRIFPLWNGPLTVKVVIIDANTEVPSTELLDDVSAHIAESAPFGSSVTVVGADILPINVGVTLVLGDGLTVNDIEDVVTRALAGFIKSLAFTSDYVSVAQIGRELLSVEGVLDYSDLTINGGTANIETTDAEFAVLGTVTINV